MIFYIDYRFHVYIYIHIVYKFTLSLQTFSHRVKTGNRTGKKRRHKRTPDSQANHKNIVYSRSSWRWIGLLIIRTMPEWKQKSECLCLGHRRKHRGASGQLSVQKSATRQRKTTEAGEQGEKVQINIVIRGTKSVDKRSSCQRNMSFDEFSRRILYFH